MNLNCNVHAASFIKGDEREEYDDVSELLHPLHLNGEYTFRYRYPLRRAATFNHVLTPEMTGEDLLVLGRIDYEEIYRQEEATAGDPGYIPGMLNRQSSEGPYGIWGHDFSDLYFESVEIMPETKMISFGMGS
jgi:hypothetical protein